MKGEPQYKVLPEGIATFFGVQVFLRWSSLTVLGLPLGGEAGSPGCVGFMPIFDSHEAAKAWRDEHHPTAGIVEMAYAEALR